MPFPEEGLVFDYKLNDGGASFFDDEEEEVKERKVIGKAARSYSN